MQLNATHDSTRKSWLASARPGSDFPLQNLPLGVFSVGSERPRGGVAIGDCVLDVGAARAMGLFSGQALEAAVLMEGANLNPLLATGHRLASALRHLLFEMLAEGSQHETALRSCLIPLSAATLKLPVAVRQFTDMSVSSFHMGRSRGNDENGDPLVRPIFKWQPIGYNGRASSVVVSGTALRRPLGQWMADGADEDAVPQFGPEPRQDYEMELGLWVGGEANPLGEPISITQAPERLFGLCILNDWSSRRIQVRESVLGPFLSKSMGTTVSPWIVTMEALAPFRIPMMTRPKTAPGPLPYLDDRQDREAGGFDIALSARVSSAKGRLDALAPTSICETNARHLYWSFAQILTHHSSAGCDLAAGDLIGSGTCSGPAIEQAACLSEMTKGGTRPWRLETGEERTYLADGDIVMCTGQAVREGYVPIGFGPCAGELLPAPQLR